MFNEIVQFDAAKLQQGKGSGIGLWSKFFLFYFKIVLIFLPFTGDYYYLFYLLFIVSNKIMKLHGGSIGVYSEGEGHGSTFYIDIPITRIRTRRHRPNDAYYQELAQGISLVHAHNVNDPDENDNGSHLGGESHGNNSVDGAELHREQSAMSGNVDANFISAIVNRKPFTSLSSSFLSAIAQNVFGSNSSSTSQSAKGPLDAKHIHKISKIGVLDSLEAGVSTDIMQKPNESRVDTHAVTAQPSIVKRQSSLLIVDDSTVNRKMLKRSLIDLVDHIDEATNGIDCVNKVISSMKSSFGGGKGYDIIITDYFMPEMNGLEATKQLRRSAYTGKIIGLTGNTDAVMIESFKKAGANIVLTKPFQGADLHALIQSKFYFEIFILYFLSEHLINFSVHFRFVGGN